ncbi:MAG: hypothetical protein M9890_02860 [Thermomicrobiales bacterium]|nr:hypothetical protein [Thermomicrobiales bacterium]
MSTRTASGHQNETSPAQSASDSPARSSRIAPHRVRLVLALALGVVFLALWWGLVPQSSPGDLVLYFDYANHIKDGHVPYRDFQIEYPPLALVPILIAFVPSHIVGGFFSGFAFLFALQNYLLALGCGLIVWSLMPQVLPDEDEDTHILRLAVYVLGFLLLGQITIARFDLMPTFLTLAAVALWLRRTPRAEVSAWLVLALAVGVKLVPAIIAPILLLDLLARRGLRTTVMQGALFGGVLAILLLPPLLIDPSGYIAAYTYQADRGIQVESIYANVLLLLSKAGLVDIVTAHAWGSFEYVSRWTAPLRSLSSVIQLAALAASYVVYALVRLHTRADESRVPAVLLTATTLTQLAFIATGKVFSPQYLIWLMPFIVLLPGHLARRTIGVFLAALVASQLIFPLFYGSLRNQTAWGALILTTRNLLIVGLVVLVFATLQRLRRSQSADCATQ